MTDARVRARWREQDKKMKFNSCREFMEFGNPKDHDACPVCGAIPKLLDPLDPYSTMVIYHKTKNELRQ